MRNVRSLISVPGVFALCALPLAIACSSSKDPEGSSTKGEASPPGGATVVQDVDPALCQSLPPVKPMLAFEGPVVPGTTVQVGQALDPIRGIHYRGVLCVEVDRSQPPTQGETVATLSIAHARNVSELARTLGVDIDASFAIGLWREHAAARFLHDGGFKSSSVFAVLRSSVRVQESGGPRPVKLEPYAKSLLEKGAYATFVRRCGSALVTRIDKGADFYIVVEFPSTTVEERNEIAQAIGPAPAQPGVIDEAAIERLGALVARYPTKISVIRAGGAGNTASLSFKSLVKLARELPAAVARAPRPVSFLAAGYDTVEPVPAQVLDRYNAVDAHLVDLGGVYNALRADANTLANYTHLLASKHPDLGVIPPDQVETCAAAAAEFKAVRDGYNQQIRELERVARVCINNRPPETCFTNVECSVPADRPPAFPTVPEGCVRSCQVELGELFAGQSLATQTVEARVECRGLVPERRYKISLQGGRVTASRGCITEDGRDVAIAVEGGFGENHDVARGRPGNDSVTFKPRPLYVTVPGDGNISARVSMTNMHGDKGCVYTASGTVSVNPEPAD